MKKRINKKFEFSKIEACSMWAQVLAPHSATEPGGSETPLSLVLMDSSGSMSVEFVSLDLKCSCRRI